MSTGGWILSIFVLIVLMALAVGIVVWIVSERSGRRGAGVVSSGATEILDRRLASGELTVEQYEQLRRTLNQTPTRTSEPRPAHPAGAA